ncbi:ABC transporter permease [Desulfonatronovibrio hydrogenovorans]|uniref:ABC transporter permease n=1 Tax=Desulfonatronovibrio hydrogenovorans TaxID=53245 RepID=UPI000552887D|nr:ABC transporter permease [Desulfonatronovibrio hydrogenovorans]
MKRSDLTLLFVPVWKRNLIVYRRIWKVNFMVPLFEPLFYLAAFGVGLSGLIGDVSYAGQEFSYIRFIAPALLATAMMFNAFFETTYASFVRMYYQKTFDAMLATPLSLEEVITAEIVWGATKSMLAATIILGVISAFGYAVYPWALLVIPLAFLGGMAFGSVGMYCTGITPSIDMFNLPMFLFVTPLFLFSGTFFPVSGLPAWGQYLALVSPLYHLVELTRFVTTGSMESSIVLSLSYLVAFAVLFYFLSIRAMRRRLIK